MYCVYIYLVLIYSSIGRALDEYVGVAAVLEMMMDDDDDVCIYNIYYPANYMPWMSM